MTLPVLALGWLLGMAAVATWGAPVWMAGAWLALLAPVGYAVAGRRGAVVLAAAAVLAVLGAARFEGWRDRDPPALAALVGSEQTVEGTVGSEPDPGLTTVRYRLDVERVADVGGWRDTAGSVLVSLHQYTELLPGDHLRLTGKLEAPPAFEGFDYRAYLARQDVVATMLFPEIDAVIPGGWSPGRTAVEWRLDLERGLQRSLPEPEASLGAGILLGRDGDLPDELADDFRVSGLAHIVAVSGSNVALVAALVFLAATVVVRRGIAALLAGAAIVLYVALAGLSGSVERAAIMAGIFLAGEAIGRQQAGLAALGGAAIAMTVLSPATALDVGFQLSLTATAGLIVFAPWVRYGIEWALARLRIHGVVPGVAVQAAAFTVAATVATLPVTWVNFGRVSLIGPLANILVEPLFVLAFALSGLTAVASVTWTPLGWWIGAAAYYPLAAIDLIAKTLADVPGAAVDVPEAGAASAVAAYAILAVLGWPAYRFLVPVEESAERPRWSRPARLVAAGAAAGGLVVAVLPVSVLPAMGPSDFEMVVLDVGQGDAILLTTPGGHHVLVDGGPSGIGLARELGAELPHWERQLDAVILTHPDEDHVAGLPEVLARYGVSLEHDTGVTKDTHAYAVYRQRAGERDEVRRGDSWELDGVRFEVLWPPDGYSDEATNETSIVLRVTYGDVHFLLTGDFEAGAQHALMALDDVSADVLKVPHHGSKTTAADFLDAVGAQVAIISVGAENRFGHPSAEVLEELTGTTMLRTDLDGRVTVKTDGHAIEYSAAR